MNKENLHKVVIALVGEGSAESWWTSPNKGFYGKTPEEALAEDPRQVRDYLMWHAYSSGG